MYICIISLILKISIGEKRIVFHIDFDIICSMEEIINPSIKDMPIVVCVFSEEQMKEV